jgi:hypothetical protein
VKEGSALNSPLESYATETTPSFERPGSYRRPQNSFLNGRTGKKAGGRKSCIFSGLERIKLAAK